jgi:lysophospholipase L1-like esterase
MKHFQLSLMFVLLSITFLGLPQQSTSASETSSKAPHADNLSSAGWWLDKMRTQATTYRSQSFRGCLFGDSISSGLGNHLGAGIINFATGGLSSVSLVEQLKLLKSQNISCQSAIIAVGTNDAWYITPDQLFTSKLIQSIHLVREMGATRIDLIPAFYSTLAASQDPTQAGSLTRVQEINSLMVRVAATEAVPIHLNDLQDLFANGSLKEDMTFDGVHLNDSGRQIYRQIVIQTFDSESLEPASHITKP